MPLPPTPLRGSSLVPPFAEASVVDVMHHGVISCPPDATLREVTEILAAHRVHSVIVEGVERDGGQERLVWRVLDDLDLVRSLARPDARDLRAADMATGPAATLSPSTPLSDAAAAMLAHGLTHMVVASERHGRPVGVVSALDLAAAAAWGRHPGHPPGEAGA
jgi:CBS domain-containing protein